MKPEAPTASFANVFERIHGLNGAMELRKQITGTHTKARLDAFIELQLKYLVESIELLPS